jgi:hypothetical protein
MAETTFDFSRVSPLMALCFNSSCPLKDNCIRFFAGLHAPADKLTGMSVYPSALHDGKCAMFKQTTIIKAAYGFQSLFKDVKSRDEHALRSAMMDYLGNRTAYYHYADGSYVLTPEQQEWIINLFKTYGYTGELRFDNYEMLYDLS